MRYDSSMSSSDGAVDLERTLRWSVAVNEAIDLTSLTRLCYMADGQVVTAPD